MKKIYTAPVSIEKWIAPGEQILTGSYGSAGKPSNNIVFDDENAPII